MRLLNWVILRSVGNVDVVFLILSYLGINKKLKIQSKKYIKIDIKKEVKKWIKKQAKKEFEKELKTLKIEKRRFELLVKKRKKFIE